MKKFYRPSTDDMIFGVCAGIARYIDVDVVLIRVAFLFSFLFFSAMPLIVYLLLAICAPRDWDLPNGQP